MKNFNFDIVPFQETRLSGEERFKETSHTLFWKGRAEGEERTAGIGFAVSNNLASILPSMPVGVCERIITIRLPLSQTRFATLINVYAATMKNSDQDKDSFYAQLRHTITKVPKVDRPILLGDFKARVGNDWKTWESALGKFGRGKMNSNGELLLGLCIELELVITNTYF